MVSCLHKRRIVPASANLVVGEKKVVSTAFPVSVSRRLVTTTSNWIDVAAQIVGLRYRAARIQRPPST